MPFRQLAHFLAVAESSSINQAAQQLDISQQSLRASLNSLENKLGFSLFARSSSGVELSPAGEAIVDDVRQFMRKVESWKEFSRRDSLVQGTVRVAATTAALNFLMLDFMRACKERCPLVTLELHETRIQEILSLMRRKACLGVMGSVPPRDVLDARREAERGGLRLESCVSDPYHVFINLNHPLAAADALHLADLRHFVAAMYPRDDQRFPYRAIYRHFSSGMPFFYMSSQEAILRVVAEDPSMAAVFPRSVARTWTRETRTGPLRWQAFR